jgi:ribonuclease R
MLKISGLREFAGNLGYKMEAFNSGRDVAVALNSLLGDAKDKPELGAIQLIALRAMAKACYSTDNIGHYGLAFPFYTHFTSPIRRYPDMMVHRLLSRYLAGKDSADPDYYAAQCKHASEREVIAAEAERESIKYKLVEFMEDKIGQQFDGHVSGITQWGIYVEIEPTKIEGMVPLRTIRSDFYDFDEDHYRVVGRRTRHIIKLGDPVKIIVKATSLEQKLLDYELVEEGIPESSSRADDYDPDREIEYLVDRPYRGGSGKSSRGSGSHGSSLKRSGKGSRMPEITGSTHPGKRSSSRKSRRHEDPRH